jgi:hypothetical protein
MERYTTLLSLIDAGESWDDNGKVYNLWSVLQIFFFLFFYNIIDLMPGAQILSFPIVA